MLKLTVAALAVVLAGAASAAGWKSLTIDASSEQAFEKSLAEFKEKLTPARASVFGEALRDIWIKGSQDAKANQREYTAADYYRQVHGLGYEGIVTLTDPTAETARQRYRAAYARSGPRARSAADIAFRGDNGLYPRVDGLRGGAPGAGWDPSK